jgi:ubiquinone biosynthesis protein UbiJ
MVSYYEGKILKCFISSFPKCSDYLIEVITEEWRLIPSRTEYELFAKEIQETEGIASDMSNRIRRLEEKFET